MSSSGSFPVWYLLVVPARQVYSHSASVGGRYFLPSLRLNQSQNATASFHETYPTGWSGSTFQPGAHGRNAVDSIISPFLPYPVIGLPSRSASILSPAWRRNVMNCP